MSVTLGIQHAKRHVPNYSVICGLSGCAKYIHVISQKARISEKKSIEHKMYSTVQYSTV